MLASLSVENLLNEQYTRHMTVFPNELTRTITGFPQPGITVKGSLRVRFAGSEYAGTPVCRRPFSFRHGHVKQRRNKGELRCSLP